MALLLGPLKQQRTARDVAKKTEKPKSWGRMKRISGQSMVKPTLHLTNRFLMLETSTIASTRDILISQSPVTELRTKKAVPHRPPHQPSNPTPVLVCSTTLWRETQIPL